MSQTLRAKIDSNFVSQIGAAEQSLSGQSTHVAGGPAAVAQKYVGHDLTAEIVSEITQAEAKITGQPDPVKQGPTSIAQSMLSASGTTSASASNTTPDSGVLDSATISKITEKEKELTGDAQPVKGGPTAQAQKHAGEAIGSENLHDITEGEKKVTGGDRVKGGPTATAQSSLGQSRS